MAHASHLKRWLNCKFLLRHRTFGKSWRDIFRFNYSSDRSTYSSDRSMTQIRKKATQIGTN